MNSTTTMSLEDLGYSEFFESGRKTLKFENVPVARVIAEYKEAYKVIVQGGQEYRAKVTGKQMFSATTRDDYPAVGDWVGITVLEEKQAVIRGILPRRSALRKKHGAKQENHIIAANIDIAFITESLDRDYNLNRVERYMVLATEGNIHPVILFNKTDVVAEGDLNYRIQQVRTRFGGIDVMTTNTRTPDGTHALQAYIAAGKTYCFLGSSGVGKSSLINALLGKDEIRTREISLVHNRGVHTTTTREMYFLENGGLLIDNPGMREVGLAESDEGITHVFGEIEDLSQGCKFSDCSHTSEPGCEVLNAIHSGKLDHGKYDNYMKLRKESEFYKMTDLEKREKARKFGRFVKKTLEELKR